jgi:hypothetical protein
MRRCLLACFSSLLLAGILGSATLHAQRPEGRIEYSKEPAAKKEDEERAPPALQYTVASLSAILIMVLLCLPTRKARTRER